MSEINPNNFSISKLLCKFFGHNLKISKSVTNHIQEYTCSKCGMEMTDTADGFLARLTPKFKETNNYIAQIHNRRRRKNYVSAS